MLLEVLQCAGHPSTTKNHQTHTVNSPEVAKLCSNEKRADVLRIKRLIHRILKKKTNLVVRTPISGKMRKEKFNG